MFYRAAFVFLVIFGLAVAAPSTEFANFNSRVPGDQLIWESSLVQQNLNFFGQSTYEISYPLDGSRSPYEITHIHVDATENTGFMDISIYGGCGTDFARLKLIAKSVKDGKYKIFIYGKKK